MAAAFSHVIFDLDGTILNTLEDLAAAGNHTCETHGWPTFAVDEYRYKVGNGMLKLVERFMPAEYAGDGRMFEQTLAEFRAYYGEHKEDHTAPYAGTIEMLGYDVLQVANEGKMVAVVPAEQADAALSAMRAARYGENAAVIGRVLPLAEGARPAVRVRTGWGSTRILDMLVGEQLPRIC